MDEDTRTFSERVARTNIGFIVSLAPADVERFAQLVEDALNETAGKLVYVTTNSKRLFIDVDRRRWDEERPRDAIRPTRFPREFDFGVR